MKTCSNCYWVDKCPEAGKRCEYYDPVFGGEAQILKEYREDLKMRHKEYSGVISEQQDLDEELSEGD